MSNRTRHTLMILAVVLISLTLLAAPARGDDWFDVHFGSHGFGVSFGATDWAVWGPSWQDPTWSVDYHAALSGYGEWVWVDSLGQCWLPWVAADWRPFTHGRWVWTSLGWTWVAYEPWGYFPHHFGHWAMAPVGWVWVPGTSYYPANVVWVSAGGWVGWYPRPPHGWIHHHHHGHHDDWGGWNDARYATYVDWRDLGSDDLGRHAVAATAVRATSPQVVVRDGVAAPSRQELGRRGVAVPEMSLERRTARVAGREVVLARPREAADSIQENAGRTVERALAPQAVGTVTRHPAGGREATIVRGGSTVSDRHSATVRSGRVDATRPSTRTQERSLTAAPRRQTIVTRQSSSAGAASRSVPASRAPSPTDPGRSVAPNVRPRVEATRTASRTVADSITERRARETTARSASATRAGTRDGGEPVRRVSSATQESQGRSEQSARHRDHQSEKRQAASRTSPHNRE